MPTYVCYVPDGLLKPAQKAEVAEAISLRHSEATGAPTFFVQVVIDEQPSALRYLGGTLASHHIWIRGDIRAGRTEEQRGQLMLNIMKDVARIVGIEESSIWVYLCNLAPTDMVEYGHVLPLPGREEEWFAHLPLPLRSRLKSLGTTEENFTL